VQSRRFSSTRRLSTALRRPSAVGSSHLSRPQTSLVRSYSDSSFESSENDEEIEENEDNSSWDGSIYYEENEIEDLEEANEQEEVFERPQQQQRQQEQQHHQQEQVIFGSRRSSTAAPTLNAIHSEGEWHTWSHLVTKRTFTHHAHSVNRLSLLQRFWQIKYIKCYVCLLQRADEEEAECGPRGLADDEHGGQDQWRGLNLIVISN